MKMLPHTANRWYGVIVTVSFALTVAQDIGGVLGDGAWAAWSLAKECCVTRAIIEAVRGMVGG